ncbi:hypothetical protein B0T21DRAFT_350620 [Apiosordaria backusii]|uniref:Uncharacterized protein n=1 Tax=Apiosordaria backusii TaxID=314023 RepID=A0AA40E662_9PEZI|nr:hypothetical protein B0T21DRAFT_350620 [Apiosordaria backusii]
MSSSNGSPSSSPSALGASTRPHNSTLGGWHPPAWWFERQRPYAMPEGIRLCRLQTGRVYTAEEYGNLEQFWNPTFHRPRLDCIPDIRPANFAQTPAHVRQELRRCLSAPGYLESAKIAREQAQREQQARLVALRENPSPNDPYMKVVRPEDWERVLPTAATPPASPPRAFPTSSREDKKKLPEPRYSWFGFGPAIAPERTPSQFVGAGERKLKRRRGVAWLREIDWIAAAKGFKKNAVQQTLDQLTIAGFVVLFSVLFLLALLGVGVWQGVEQLLDITYGHESIEIGNEVEFVEDEDHQIAISPDAIIGEGTGRRFGEWRHRVVDAIGTEAEAVEAFSGRLQALSGRHTGRR